MSANGDVVLYNGQPTDIYTNRELRFGLGEVVAEFWSTHNVCGGDFEEVFIDLAADPKAPE